MPIKKVMKTVLKKGMKKQEPSFTHFSEAEKDRLRRLQDEGKSPSKVAELLGRDLSSVNRHFNRNMLPPKKLPKPVGRPPARTEKQNDRVVDTAERLIQAAGKGRKPYQVTASMIKTAMKYTQLFC
jgi:IS30 family transposase